MNLLDWVFALLGLSLRQGSCRVFFWGRWERITIVKIFIFKKKKRQNTFKDKYKETAYRSYGDCSEDCWSWLLSKEIIFISQVQNTFSLFFFCLWYAYVRKNSSSFVEKTKICVYLVILGPSPAVPLSVPLSSWRIEALAAANRIGTWSCTKTLWHKFLGMCTLLGRLLCLGISETIG